jgi:hypothetical protein
MIDGPLAERTTEDGRRRIQLTAAEREDARNERMIEAAVALYLDVTGRHTNKQIAEDLGISVHQLKNMTCTEEFEKCWNEHVLEINHDPRLKATKEHLMDLLPKSLLALQDVLENGSANAKVQGAKLVLTLNGVVQRNNATSDRKELVDFLAGANVQIQQNNIQMSLPEHYQDAMENFDRAIDGEFVEVSDVGNAIPED